MLETSPSHPPIAGDISKALQQGLERYLAGRRERIPQLLERTLNLQSCVQIQSRHFLKDLTLNPINTLWSIPYLSIRKTLDLGEKLGWEGAKLVTPTIPRAARTDFQKETERLIQVDLFGLGGTRSEFVRAMEKQHHEFFKTKEWKDLEAGAESEIRKAITDYCNTQNGFTDLACSGGILVAAQYFFGNRSLDIFAMGHSWAALWSRQKAETHFPLGRKLGHIFYRVAPAPAPHSDQVWLATAMALGLLALFSTVVSMISFPVQNRLGFQEKQLEKLLQTIEDKLLLKFTKGLRTHT